YSIDRTPIYGTGGYAFTHAKREDVKNGASAGETPHGWASGARGEQAFTDSRNGRGEYRDRDYRQSHTFCAPGLDGDNGSYAFTHAKLEDVNTGASEGETLHGWTIGAGVEQAFTDSMIGRVEYRYSDYSKSDMFGAAGLDGDIDSHSIMVGVSMKF